MKTRKLPFSLRKDGRASLRGEHLVPCLEFPRQNLFVGVKSGKRYEKGYIVYLGEHISTEDILAKLRVEEGQLSEAQSVINSFLSALQTFRIGAVISVSFSEKDECVLKKEADHPPTEEFKRKLP